MGSSKSSARDSDALDLYLHLLLWAKFGGEDHSIKNKAVQTCASLGIEFGEIESSVNEDILYGGNLSDLPIVKNHLSLRQIDFLDFGTALNQAMIVIGRMKTIGDLGGDWKRMLSTCRARALALSERIMPQQMVGKLEKAFDDSELDCDHAPLERWFNFFRETVRVRTR